MKAGVSYLNMLMDYDQKRLTDDPGHGHSMAPFPPSQCPGTKFFHIIGDLRPEVNGHVHVSLVESSSILQVIKNHGHLNLQRNTCGFVRFSHERNELGPTEMHFFHQTYNCHSIDTMSLSKNVFVLFEVFICHLSLCTPVDLPSGQPLNYLALSTAQPTPC